MVFSATDVPIQCAFERMRDTTQSCYERCVQNAYGNNKGDGLPNLDNIVFASDRGYWISTLLFLFILAAGAEVIGTIKRTGWFPFTYNRKNEPGKPMNIETRGYKAAFYKTLKYALKSSNGSLLRNLELTAVAYRSGTSSAVSMVLSS